MVNHAVLSWLPLTLCCAFSLALSDAVTKRYFSGHPLGEVLLIRFGLTGLLLVPFWALQPWPDPAIEFWFWLGGLIPLEVLAMGLYMRAIQTNPLSHTLPYLAFTPVFAIFTAYLFLGERVTLYGFLGVLAIVFAAWLLNSTRSMKGVRGVFLPFQMLWQEKGPRYMLFTAVLYSLTATMGKGAMQYVPPLFFAAFYYSAVGVTVIIWFVLKAKRTTTSTDIPFFPALAVSLTLGFMVLTHFMALQQVEVAYMISVKRTSLLFGVLLGVIWFAEAGAKRNLLVSMIMVLGVALILL